MAAEYVRCSMTSHTKFTPTTANQKRWTLTTANRMLRNCQEDTRGKSYDKHDPCYAVPRR